MARPTLELITALRATADRLDGGVKFHWNHMGSCNCGHLAQTLTKLTKEEIHSRALESAGDWAEQAREYCPTSGYPLHSIIDTMIGAGLNVMDIANLERLEDERVLARIPRELHPLDYRDREHAILYIRAWADFLESEWREELEKREKKAYRASETVGA